MNLRIFLLPLALIVLATEAYGGSLKDGTWNPSACGAMPQPPLLDFGESEAYNKSIDDMHGYAQSLGIYQACVVKEANRDMQTISQAANTAQQTAQARDDAYQAQLEKAPRRFQRSNNSVNLPFNRSNTEAPCNCAR